MTSMNQLPNTSFVEVSGIFLRHLSHATLADILIKGCKNKNQVIVEAA